MMIRSFVICVVVAATSLAQNPPSKQSPAAPAATPTPQATPPTLLKRDERPAEVPANQVIITIRGICPASTAAATTNKVPATSDCVTTVTKEQFDNMINAINSKNQTLSPTQRRELAGKYVELLAYSEAAKAAGVENTPLYQEVMRVVKLNTLSEIYLRQLSEQYRNPTDEEIQAYYQANQQKFDAAKLARIYIPKNDPDPQATAAQKQDFEKKAPTVADDIQARAAKGEEMSKLQKDAYTALGITATPPSTELNLTRHGTFPAKLDAEIFSHKAGEVFRSDDANGYMIFRVETRETAPLESVKQEVAQQIFREKMEAKTKELNAPVHADFDDKYFGPPPPATAPTAPKPSK